MNISNIGTGSGYIIVTDESKSTITTIIENSSSNKNRILSLIQSSVIKDSDSNLDIGLRFYLDTTNNWSNTGGQTALTSAGSVSAFVGGLSEVTEILVVDELQTVTIEAGGGTSTIGVNNQPSKTYYLTSASGPVTMTSPFTLQVNGAHTPKDGTIIKFLCDFNLDLTSNNINLTLFGKELKYDNTGDIPLAFAQKPFVLETMYDGSSWTTIVYFDSTAEEWINKIHITDDILTSTSKPGLVLDATDNGLQVLVDDTTIEIDGISGEVQVKDESITSTKLSDNNKYISIPFEVSAETGFKGVKQKIPIPFNANLVKVEGSVWKLIEASDDATFRIYDGVGSLVDSFTVPKNSAQETVITYVNGDSIHNYNSVGTYLTDTNDLWISLEKSTAGGIVKGCLIFKLS